MTRAATQSERFDHDRDHRKHEPPVGRPSFAQRLAVARLLGFSEAIAASGLVGTLEPDLRKAIAETLVAFNMPSKTERADA